MSTKQSISKKSKGGIPLWFGAIFLVAGALLTWFILVRPVGKVIAARSWVETPCRILSSDVAYHRSSNNKGSGTYSVEIRYEYVIDGVAHQSGRYKFMGGSTGGRAGKERIVSEHPPGSTATCFVNPENPSEAVIERGFTPDMAFGLFGLLFFGVGVGLMIAAIKSKAAPSAEQARTAERIADAGAGGGPVVLEPPVSPRGKVFAMIFVAAIWNGIVWLFIHNGAPWLFMLIFLAVGLGLVGGVVYFILALFNPSPRLTVNASALPLGSKLDVEWSLSGAVDRIENWRVWLEGREEATYRRGTNRSTDKNIFAELEVAVTTERDQMRAGRARIVIPADTMHSFESSNNKIVWSLKVCGTISKWPDVSEEFPFKLLPVKKP